MSTIFISHASKDLTPAKRVKKFLDDLGHSVFLDADVRDGLAAGTDWEQELYRHLRACRALVVLTSRRSAKSRWCFVEIAQARALGKPVLPLRIEDSELDNLLGDTQAAVLAEGWEVALERLRLGLLREGLDPRELFDWPPPPAPGEERRHGRPSPYPGLPFFEERHAGVFFGRDKEIDELREKLKRVFDHREAPVVLVLGASGTGKSSLVRAGVLPRLRKNPDRWVVLDAVRCYPDDPVGELAVAFKKAFAEVGVSRRASEMERELRKAVSQWAAWGEQLAESPIAGPPNYLLDLALDLSRHASSRSAKVLVTIDQFEELLQSGESLDEVGRSRKREGKTASIPLSNVSGFLRILREAAEARRSPMVLLATLRDDFAPAFHGHSQLLGLGHLDVQLAPLDASKIRRVIEGPAEKAGIDIEKELVDLLEKEAGDGNSLPLLAFALRQLDDRCGDDFKLELREYETALGSLEKAVGKTAERLITAELKPLGYDSTKRRQNEEVESRLGDLKTAFLRLVQLTDRGRYARRTVRWNQLPPEAHPILERFVDGRLLVSGKDADDKPTLEVAHEKLFSSWPLLAGWIKDNPEVLKLSQEVRREAERWEPAQSPEVVGQGPKAAKSVSAPNPDDYLFKGSRLERVRELTESGSLTLEDRETRFIAASEKAAQRELTRARLYAVVGLVLTLLASLGLVGTLVAQRSARASADETLAIKDYFDKVFVPTDSQSRVASPTDLQGVLGQATSDISKLGDYRDFQAQMLDRLATAMVAVGEGAKAEELYRMAIREFEVAFEKTEAPADRKAAADRLISALLARTLVLPVDGEPPSNREAWEERITTGRRAVDIAKKVYPPGHAQVVKANGELAADLNRVGDAAGWPMLMESLGQAMKEKRSGDEVGRMFEDMLGLFLDQHEDDLEENRTYLQPDPKDPYVQHLDDLVRLALGDDPEGVLKWALPTSLEALAEYLALRGPELAPRLSPELGKRLKAHHVDLAGHLYRCAEWYAISTYPEELACIEKAEEAPRVGLRSRLGRVQACEVDAEKALTDPTRRHILTMIIQQGRARFLERHERLDEAADLLDRMKSIRSAALGNTSPFEIQVIADLAWAEGPGLTQPLPSLAGLKGDQ